jgi:hypothetical protein
MISVVKQSSTLFHKETFRLLPVNNRLTVALGMNATASQKPITGRQFTGFRCPTAVLTVLKTKATLEGRSLSNYIVHVLSKDAAASQQRNG